MVPKRASKLEFTRRVACNAAGMRITSFVVISWERLSLTRLPMSRVLKRGKVEMPKKKCRSVPHDISRLDKFSSYLIKSHCWLVITCPIFSNLGDLSVRVSSRACFCPMPLLAQRPYACCLVASMHPFTSCHIDIIKQRQRG